MRSGAVDIHRLLLILDQQMKSRLPLVENPDEPALDLLCEQLRDLSVGADDISWPAQRLELCGDCGVFRWFLPTEFGGFAWSDEQIARGYLKLAAACLTTTFVITQRTGACRRIAGSENDALKKQTLGDLASGDSFATVGISHLTTSRRHLSRPVLTASENGTNYVLDGFSPWVTGGPHAETVVLGATMDDGRQVLIAAPTGIDGISAEEPEQLVALTGSHTGRVRCEHARVPKDYLLAGPAENVMNRGSGAATGGLQTSTLAIGLSRAAIDFISDQASVRSDLQSTADALDEQQRQIVAQLLSSARGEPVVSNEQLRIDANSLALRSTQAALSAAKGAGFVTGHPAGRWCREALFFLVWSCPQSVAQANLCEFAGIEF